jgi:hypothetical protein
MTVGPFFYLARWTTDAGVANNSEGLDSSRLG